MNGGTARTRDTFFHGMTDEWQIAGMIADQTY